MPGPGGPGGGGHGGPGGPCGGGPRGGFGGPRMGGPRPGFGGPPPPRRRWYGGYGYGPGCGGCLFSFLFIVGLGVAGITGIASLFI